MRKLIRNFLRACHVCHGLGYIEVSNGTKECYVCKGKGRL